MTGWPRGPPSGPGTALLQAKTLAAWLLSESLWGTQTEYTFLRSRWLLIILWTVDLGIPVIASSSVHDKRQFSSIKPFTFWMLGPAEVETGLPFRKLKTPLLNLCYTAPYSVEWRASILISQRKLSKNLLAWYTHFMASWNVEPVMRIHNLQRQH